MELYSTIFLIMAVFFLAVGIFAFLKGRRFKLDLEKREVEMKRKMYELAILKELGERMGYSLNIQNIVDVIIGSLQQFIDYSVVSYMFLKPEEIVFKVHLEKSVSRKFIDKIKERMLRSLSALKDKDVGKKRIEEVLSGAILVEDLEEPVNSFFNIPLVIAGKLVGVLTVADTKEGLYQEEEMTILYKIVQQASQAVTKLQEVVETEQKKLNSMVESMKDGVIMTDKDYRVAVANPAIKTMLGISKDNINIFDLIDNLKDSFDIRDKLEESIKLYKSLIFNNILIKEKFFQISVLPVKSSLENDVLGGVVVFHDITKEKELEKIKEDFTSMIAHELRSPLDAIKKMIEVIMMTKIKKQDKEKYFEMIYSSSSNMLSLVSNLLDAAKIEAGKFELVKKPEKIANVIKGRIDFFEIETKSKKINLHSMIDKNLPEKIILDSFRIGQVLNNLISNALKFTSEGGEIIVQALYHKKGQEVKKETEKAGIKWLLEKLDNVSDSLVIAITDTGNGIARSDISKLFNKFKQVEREEGRGTGLGLVISKGIVEAHGGTIGVSSKQGVGSTFYFTVPLNLKSDILKKNS